MTRQQVRVHGVFAHDTRSVIVAAFGSAFIVLDSESGQILAAPEDHAIHREQHAAAPHAGDLQHGTPAARLPTSAMPDGAVRAVAFHPTLPLMAVAADSRVLHVWHIESWQLLHSLTLPKRPNALVFEGCTSTNAGVEVDGDLIVADKFGDVYRVPASRNSIEKPRLLLGHCSLITDMVLCREHGRLVTSDRDEKIRVSMFPDAFEIDGFCLGHTSFVTKMCRVPDSPTEIASAGGDGAIIFWDFVRQAEIQRLDAAIDLDASLRSATVVSIKSSAVSRTVAVLFEAVPAVYLLHRPAHAQRFALRAKLPLPAAAFDIEFVAPRGDLVVAFAAGEALVGVSEYADAADGPAREYAPVAADVRAAKIVNAAGTKDLAEGGGDAVKDHVGSYLKILRKKTEDDGKKGSKRKDGNNDDDGGDNDNDGKDGAATNTTRPKKPKK